MVKQNREHKTMQTDIKRVPTEKEIAEQKRAKFMQKLRLLNTHGILPVTARQFAEGVFHIECKRASYDVEANMQLFADFREGDHSFATAIADIADETARQLAPLNFPPPLDID